LKEGFEKCGIPGSAVRGCCAVAVVGVVAVFVAVAEVAVDAVAAARKDSRKKHCSGIAGPAVVFVVLLLSRHSACSHLGSVAEREDCTVAVGVVVAEFCFVAVRI
jgi:uncharacterized membrane protein